MLAKALAFAANCPLIGVSTLECFAPSAEGPFTVLIDARIGGAYYITGIKQKNEVLHTVKPQVVPLELLAGLLKETCQIITPKANALKQKLEVFCPNALWEECRKGSSKGENRCKEMIHAGVEVEKNGKNVIIQKIGRHRLPT
jgi:tRNA A37 threonylcarbamoyladenosine modification protein TsaB